MFEADSCSILLNNLDRLGALSDTGLFGTSPEEAFTRLNRLATKLLKAPISIFSLIGDKSQFFKSAEGFEITLSNNEVPIDVSVCQYSLQGKPLSIPDTIGHPYFSENPAVKALNIVGYLGIPVVTKDGHAIGAVCVIDHKQRHWTEEEISILEEITSSFLSEIELRQALTRAERESKLREEFISVASHELLNPLNTLRLQTQILQKKSDKGEVQENDKKKFFKSVDKQLQRLTLLIDDMTDLTRLNRDVFSLRKEKLNISDLGRSIIENFQDDWKQTGSAVEVEIEEGISANIDGIRIEQVLTNLFNNTIKYAPGAKIKISIHQNANDVLIRVVDSGPGIPLEAQARLFSKYERLKSDVSVQGLGLGLYISRQIARQHGGDLTLESEGKQGSSFTLSLPR